jgi:hypothetical protein
MSEVSLFENPSEIERIVEARNQIVSLYQEIGQKFQEIGKIKKTLGDLYCDVRIDRIPFTKLPDQSSDEVAQNIGLDKSIWKLLIEGTIGKLMSSSQRTTFSTSLHEGDYPPITKEVLYTTLEDLNRRAPDILLQSVYDLWSKLCPSYKSNDAPSFGKKFILEYGVDYNKWSGSTARISFHKGELLMDLWKITSLFSKSATHTMNVLEMRKTLCKPFPLGTLIPLPFGNVKLYKKGSLHVMLDEDLRSQLNVMLSSAAGKALWK